MLQPDNIYNNKCKLKVHSEKWKQRDFLVSSVSVNRNTKGVLQAEGKCQTMEHMYREEQHKNSDFNYFFEKPGKTSPAFNLVNCLH